MKIRIEYGEYEEPEWVLHCKSLDAQLQAMLDLLQERTQKITAFHNKEIYLLRPADMYYAEVVDGKTFICTRNMVLETNFSLADLQNAYDFTGVVRIGKSQLINLYQVASLKSLPNSRIEITLKNGEKLIASRHYIQYLKAKIGMLD